MSLEARVEAASAALRDALARHPSAALATSFGAEDMVLLDLVDRLGLAVDAFTLDTGRLHEETYALMARARVRYPRTPVRVLFPDAARIESWVAAHGINGFRDDVGLRKECCAIRKLEPLARALRGRELWITGLRREQSPTRSAVAVIERDDANGLMKLNPLADWSADDVRAYVEAHQVPVNELHARGFPSIGCAPCTRAIAAGEDERAGRWWWEQPMQRECGLHVGADGRLVRAGAAKATGRGAAAG
jgi:phosphoadenosine phosphosulfate reductase